MAPIKFLLGLFSLAILSCSLGPTSANAMSIDNHIVNRHVAHDSLAKKDRLTRRRYKQREGAAAPPAAPSPTPSPPSTPKKAVVRAASPSSDPASSSTPASTNPSNTGTKFSLAWGGHPEDQSLFAGKANFLYNWTPIGPSGIEDSGFTYVPQLWGSDWVDEFKKTVVKGYADYVLGFNEPNEKGQASLSYQEGVQLWQDNIQPLSQLGYKLITPATSSNPNGLTWVQDFKKACQGCTFDAVAIHWYDVKFADFQKYVENWYNAFGLDIWVTEYACQNFNDLYNQPTPDEIQEFHQQAASWLKSQSYVKMAAPFGAMRSMGNASDPHTVQDTNRLISSDGKSLTALGAQLVNIYSG